MYHIIGHKMYALDRHYSLNALDISVPSLFLRWSLFTCTAVPITIFSIRITHSVLKQCCRTRVGLKTGKNSKVYSRELSVI